MTYQLDLFSNLTFIERKETTPPFKIQLLKWIGNKQRFAHEIINYFPQSFNTYYEPFLGSGGVLGVLAPQKAIGSDSFEPLIEIWQTLKNNPETLKLWYLERWQLLQKTGKKEGYERIKLSYNIHPNPSDLLFISRSCYGGVVRFRKDDGFISTPVGIHEPISPASFNYRVDLWHDRVKNTDFLCLDYEEAMLLAKPGDLIYCDPPYTDCQNILYGAQKFDIEHLMSIISECKTRGVYIALSIDGTKKSGKKKIDLPIPNGLFEREVFINLGRSMLRRFQLEGETLEDELVADRLLLTY